MANLKDKVIIITGAGAGLGQATALQLAKDCAKLTLVDLDEKGLEETKKLILEAVPSTEILLIAGNVADEEVVKNYVNKTVE